MAAMAPATGCMEQGARAAADVEYRLCGHDEREIKVEVAVAALAGRERVIQFGEIDVGEVKVNHRC
jgi:hypothetical protein